jgi:hypothetical protein
MSNTDPTKYHGEHKAPKHNIETKQMNNTDPTKYHGEHKAPKHNIEN